MLEMLKALKNNDGLTLKNGTPIEYKTGWQVATEGIETTNIETANKAIKNMGGNCGVWFADGVYYIDKSFRVKTKVEAIKIGQEHNQISVFGWARKNLAYC